MNKILYKTFKGGFKNEHGNTKWNIGEWVHQDGIIELCSNGFHASENIIDAMGYVTPAIIAKVEVKGDSDIQNDKQCWSDMRIIEAYEWKKEDSVALSIFAAELCIKNYEKEYPDDDRPRKAIEAAKKWLENSTKKNQNAARSAAESARSAAESARSAARSAAWSAWSAARSAAESARSAAWSAESARSSERAKKKIMKQCHEFVLKRLTKKNIIK